MQTKTYLTKRKNNEISTYTYEEIDHTKRNSSL